LAKPRCIAKRRISIGTSRGAIFRDYHFLLDEQADQLFAMTDEIAERARKIGASTIRSTANGAGAGRVI
jgi:starvation-inducible DNA-binding protein